VGVLVHARRSAPLAAILLWLAAACSPAPSGTPAEPSMSGSTSSGSAIPAVALPGRFAVTVKGGGLWALHGDGSERRELTSPREGVDISPTWAPDASRLAFRHSTGASSSGQDTDMIRIIQADGSGGRDLIAGSFPAWSPDGTWIAFRGNVGVDLAVIKPDGSGLTSLGVRNAECPTWSPDGRQILFCRNEDASGRVTDDWDVWVMNRDGTGQHRLTSDSSRDYPICWSTDGMRIVIFSERDGQGASFVMDADGSSVARVTDAPDLSSVNVCLPDGRFIIASAGGDIPDWFVLDTSGTPEPIPQLSGAFDPIGWVDSSD
jgi:Tol biopolymer transport system component